MKRPSLFNDTDPARASIPATADSSTTPLPSDSINRRPRQESPDISDSRAKRQRNVSADHALQEDLDIGSQLAPPDKTSEVRRGTVVLSAPIVTNLGSDDDFQTGRSLPVFLSPDILGIQSYSQSHTTQTSRSQAGCEHQPTPNADDIQIHQSHYSPIHNSLSSSPIDDHLLELDEALWDSDDQNDDYEGQWPPDVFQTADRQPSLSFRVGTDVCPPIDDGLQDSDIAFWAWEDEMTEDEISLQLEAIKSLDGLDSRMAHLVNGGLQTCYSSHSEMKMLNTLDNGDDTLTEQDIGFSKQEDTAVSPAHSQWYRPDCQPDAPRHGPDIDVNSDIDWQEEVFCC